MRARMFRDDLEHVVEEIENSKTMWLGIQRHVHGYDEIDVDDKISVRSEVARLTRLYESAVKKYVSNNPDMYSMGGGMLDAVTGLRARPGAGVQLPAVGAPTDVAGAAAVPPPAASAPEDESPATAKEHGDKDKDKNKDKDDGGDDEGPATAKDDAGKDDDKGSDKGKAKEKSVDDDDESPATAKEPAKETDDKSEETKAEDGGPDAKADAKSPAKADDAPASTSQSKQSEDAAPDGHKD